MYLKHSFLSWMCQVADLEMSSLHHHGLDICIYYCYRLPLGNMPPRMPVATGLISSIIVVVPIWNIPTMFKLAQNSIQVEISQLCYCGGTYLWHEDTY